MTDTATLIERLHFSADTAESRGKQTATVTLDFLREAAAALAAAEERADKAEQDAREWADASIENGEAFDKAEAQVAALREALEKTAALLSMQCDSDLESREVVSIIREALAQ